MYFTQYFCVIPRNQIDFWNSEIIWKSEVHTEKGEIDIFLKTLCFQL
jgi:hypothetical protein